MSAYFVACVLVAFAAGSLRRAQPRRVLAVAGLLGLAAVSRNLAWVFACFELAHLVATPSRRGSIVPSALGLVGLALLLLGGGTADPARLVLSLPVAVGVAVVVAALALRWLSTGHRVSWCLLPYGVAFVAFLSRLVGFAPDLASPVVPLAGACALVAGGVVAAWSESTPVFARGASLWMVGFSALALTVGPRTIPDVMLDVALATAALVLLRLARTPWGVGLTAASLTSLPPLPGMMGKLPILAELGAAPTALVLLGWVLLAVGSGREMARGVRRRSRAGSTERLATAVVVAWVLAVVVLADPLHALVVRASMLP